MGLAHTLATGGNMPADFSHLRSAMKATGLPILGLEDEAGEYSSSENSLYA
jgi:hypothetical protein